MVIAIPQFKLLQQSKKVFVIYYRELKTLCKRNIFSKEANKSSRNLSVLKIKWIFTNKPDTTKRKLMDFNMNLNTPYRIKHTNRNKFISRTTSVKRQKITESAHCKVHQKR
jgi:hypothetical protein